MPKPQTTDAIQSEPVSKWLAENIKSSSPPYSFELIPAGQSNLTFLVSDSKSQKWVLRRPPLHQILATAHDMGREHKNYKLPLSNKIFHPEADCIKCRPRN